MLSNTLGLNLVSNNYGYYYGLYFFNNNLNYGTYYDNSDENYQEIPFNLPLSKNIEYGDKLAVILDNGILSVYKNSELIGQIQADSRATFCNPDYILNYEGFKKDFAYSCSFALPATSTQGNASIYKYSVEDWVNNKPIPIHLLYGLRGESHSSFPAKYGSFSNLVAIAPKTQAGVYNTQLLYATASTSSKAFTLFSYESGAYIKYQGSYRLRAKVYIPSDNTNLKKLLFRVGSSTVLKPSPTLQIVSSSGIDANGYVTTPDAWVQVDVLFKYTGISGLKSLSMVPTNASNASNWAGANVETNDRFYIASASVWGQEGFNACYEGGLICGRWADHTGNGYDITASDFDVLSYPQDVANSYARVIPISSFSSQYYEYDSQTPPNGYELMKVILRFDSNIPDTRNEPDQWYQNRFILSHGSGSINVREVLPAIPANTNYIITPTTGRGSSAYYNLEISAMYNISCGGSVTLIYQRLK